MPLSSCQGSILSLTTTIFLNESFIRLREFISFNQPGTNPGQLSECKKIHFIGKLDY